MYPDVAALVAVVWPQDTLLNAVMLRTLFYLNLHREVEDLIDMDISEVVQHAVMCAATVDKDGGQRVSEGNLKKLRRKAGARSSH